MTIREYLDKRYGDEIDTSACDCGKFPLSPAPGKMVSDNFETFCSKFTNAAPVLEYVNRELDICGMRSDDVYVSYSDSGEYGGGVIGIRAEYAEGCVTLCVFRYCIDLKSSMRLNKTVYMIVR